MRRFSPHRMLRLVGTALAAVLTAALPTACESIYDELDPCRVGVSLRFVYDYNMEFANAFPRKVDCLTVLVYDADDRWVETRTVTGPELADEEYRMVLDLEPGEYSFVAYGGMACEKSSFTMTPAPAGGAARGDLRVALDADCLTDPARKNLHAMYWGALRLAAADSYAEGTVEMMKNTNNIRIVLQQINGKPVDGRDFEFEITDDNTLFDADNDLIANGEVAYTPWAVGQATTGVLDNGQEVKVGYAELSTSRLMTRNSPRLTIRRKDDGAAIVEIPLIRYLLLCKSEYYAEMGSQEFLDRESEWSWIFFLGEDNLWLRTFIKINDWTVRINDSEL
ncbi:FimB/Mfa2 family fimbrial subunit [uncultured Alistipes sp.]|uniref:FimB/Mfa2 family fimbrial subunit n=1 Tax=uncultured Alistipes sp. TaxID=538949 RepID=UPI0026213692|nr:FimB/Mfa2 family fimbrial subunit [uncultured Alistipes sp.]